MSSNWFEELECRFPGCPRWWARAESEWVAIHLWVEAGTLDDSGQFDGCWKVLLIGRFWFMWNCKEVCPFSSLCACLFFLFGIYYENRAVCLLLFRQLRKSQKYSSAFDHIKYIISYKQQISFLNSCMWLCWRHPMLSFCISLLHACFHHN